MNSKYVSCLGKSIVTSSDFVDSSPSSLLLREEKTNLQNRLWKTDGAVNALNMKFSTLWFELKNKNKTIINIPTAKMNSNFKLKIQIENTLKA